MHPVGANGDLVNAANQIKVFRKLKVVADPGTGGTVLASDCKVVRDTEEQVIRHGLRHIRAELRGRWYSVGVPSNNP